MAGAGAARDTRVDDLDRLIERGLEASVNCRFALAVTLYTRAEALAAQLHDDTCLVPAWLRKTRATSLHNQGAMVRKTAGREATGTTEAAALYAQESECVQDVVALVARRTAAGTMVRRSEGRVACVRCTCSPRS